MSDNPTFTPSTDPKIILDHLRPVLDQITQAFTVAIPFSSDFFSRETEPVERTLFAGIVRWQVKRSLKQLGIDAELEFEMDDISNIGLILHCEGFQLRILKARESKVPVSNSTLREEFYQQNFAFETAQMLQVQMPKVLNLVVLWETDYTSEVALSVACPKREVEGNSEGRRKVECYWMEPITEPVGVKAGHDLQPLAVVDSELEEVTLLDDSVEEADSDKQRDQREMVRAAVAVAANRKHVKDGGSEQ